MKNYFHFSAPAVLLLMLLAGAPAALSDSGSPVVDQRLFDSKGYTMDSLSHRQRNITCGPSLMISLNNAKPLSWRYQVLDAAGTVVFQGDTQYNNPEKYKFFMIVHFPRAGRYKVNVLLHGPYPLLSYSVDCTSGYLDAPAPVFTTPFFDRLGFDRDSLKNKNLVIPCDGHLVLNLSSDRMLRYVAGVKAAGPEEKRLNPGMRKDWVLIQRYRGMRDFQLHAFFRTTGYYRLRLHADPEMDDRGGVFAEYIVHVTGANSLTDPEKEAYLDEESRIPAVAGPAPKMDYSKIDAHIKRTPLELREDPARLTAYFSKVARTESEKVRAIYTWLQTFIQYDQEMERTRDLTSDLWVYRLSLKGMLERRKAICSGYARLFVFLARSMGLEAVHISGTMVGFRQSHAWNAVRIDGEWRLLDATAAIGQNIVMERNFLPDPAVWIRTHVPRSRFWRLMP